MRIDSNQGPQSVVTTAQASTQKATALSAQEASQSSLGEDQAQISGAHTQVQALAAQAAQLPEVRQEKVQALRQAIEAGRYHVSPENVAGGLLAHMVAGPAA